MVARLDRISPETGPHKFYVAFRYTRPTSDDALRAMHYDGIERAIAFTQYPQFSCSTTGSSLNEPRRAADRTGLRDAFHWSLVDRWPVHPGFIEAMTETVQEGLSRFAPSVRDRVTILFSAHSLPLDVIDRGDSYPQEVGASVQRVVECLGAPNPFILAYQSDVGPVRWLGPSTEQVIRRLGGRGQRELLVVPIAFTSDHIETLSELDREYGEVAHEVGITQYVRAPALNARPRFLDALAEIVKIIFGRAPRTAPNTPRVVRDAPTRNAGTSSIRWEALQCRPGCGGSCLALDSQVLTEGKEHPSDQAVGHLANNLAFGRRQRLKLSQCPLRFLLCHLPADLV